MLNNYISHLIFDNKENSRIELIGIVLPVPLNQIKVIIHIISLPVNGTFVIFSCFTSKLKENVGGSLGGRAGQRLCCPPPLKLLGRPALPSAPPPSRPRPLSYAYDLSPAITEWAAIQATNVSANRTQQFHESNIFTQSDAGICFIHTSWHTYAYFRIVIRYNRHLRWYWLGQAADHACSGCMIIHVHLHVIPLTKLD